MQSDVNHESNSELGRIPFAHGVYILELGLDASCLSLE